MFNLTIVLDNLRSCHNVGSIIRTANGFKTHNFIFIGTTPYPALKNDRRLNYQIIKQTKQIAKTSLGAELTIKGTYYSTHAEFLQSKTSDLLICIEQTVTSQALNEFQLSQDAYLVFGNEVEGISKNLLSVADHHLIIPMDGTKESFNVAVTSGIVLYTLSKF